MNYYILDTDGPLPLCSVSFEDDRELYYSDFQSAEFWDFADVVSPTPPLRFDLHCDDPSKPYTMVPIYYGPLFRDDLIEALLAAGVDNLQLFDVLLVEPKTGREFTNYKLVNIIGLADIVDKKGSKMMGIGDEVFPDHYARATFRTELDVADDALMFRLSGASSAIVIHERVRRSIEKHKIPHMYYYESGKWAG